MLIIIIIIIIITVETGQEGNITILWNQQMQTDTTIPNNKPDITIRDFMEYETLLI